ncbi:MAG: FAD-dependent oxidoreductase [Rhodospirillaceae bacterium]|nr:FAD-dependent oxidoreductase [Rhodospirillaceae bacterium]
MESYVVIGAGQAGGRAVEAMRASGFEGRIDLIGAEPHLPYERPPLSKELLTEDAPFELMHDEAWYAEKDISVHLGAPVTSIDPAAKRVTVGESQILAYDKLLLTTGGFVRKLTIDGAGLKGVEYLRTIEESRAIGSMLAEGARIVVVGGGFIGLEIAASARKRGCQVTVLEAADRLMGRALPPEIGQAYEALHRGKGVDVRLNTAIERIEGTGSVEAVVTAAGDKIAADGVVVGIGIDPDTALAEAAGLEIANGIVVDEFCRTSDPAIYAAGDATDHPNPFAGRRLRLESWQNAQNQAIAAANNMCGAETPFSEVPWFWSDQFDVNLQMCGAPENWDRIVTRGDIAACDGLLFQMQGDAIVGAIGLGRPRDMRFIKRMMGAGKTATDEQLADESVGFRDLMR